jgi:aminoglycoside 6'-N-acetyltransferase
MANEDVRLHGDRVTLRVADPEEIATAADRIAAGRQTARWWGGDRAKVFGWLMDPDTIVWAIEVAGELAGVVQVSPEDDPDYEHAGLDIAVFDEYQDRGNGTDALRTLAQWLLGPGGRHRLTVDPALDNRRSVAACGHAGFRPVGVMRAYERGDDGTWHDGLLLDMIREDLRPDRIPTSGRSDTMRA